MHETAEREDWGLTPTERLRTMIALAGSGGTVAMDDAFARELLREVRKLQDEADEIAEKAAELVATRQASAEEVLALLARARRLHFRNAVMVVVQAVLLTLSVAALLSGGL